MSYEEEVHLASKPNANTALQEESSAVEVTVVKGRYGNVQVYKNGERFHLPDAWVLKVTLPPITKKSWWEFWK